MIRPFVRFQKLAKKICFKRTLTVSGNARRAGRQAAVQLRLYRHNALSSAKGRAGCLYAVMSCVAACVCGPVEEAFEGPVAAPINSFVRP